MNLQPPKVSVTEPVSQALERVKQVLFKPFSFGKWIAIGFCAWIASLGGGGGGGGRFNFNSGGFPHGTGTFPTTTPTPAPFPPPPGTVPGGPVPMPFPQPKSDPHAFDHAYNRAHDFLAANAGWLIPLGVVLVVFVLAIMVVFLWLGSRGTFMLLDCVAQNRGEVAEPWKRYRNEANSLWRFRLALTVVGLILILPLVAGIGWQVFEMIKVRGVDGGHILGVLGLGLVMFVVALVLGVISSFTQQFATTIMYAQGGTCVQAWGVLRELVGANKGRFVLYLLFQIVIGMAVGMLVMAFIVCTLFIGFFLLVIPFVGTVVLLPIIVFYRAYSIYYLAQYGDEFLVFAQVEPPALPIQPNIWGEPPLPPPVR